MINSTPEAATGIASQEGIEESQVQKAKLADFVNHARNRPLYFLLLGILLGALYWIIVVPTYYGLGAAVYNGDPEELQIVFSFQTIVFLSLIEALGRLGKRLRIDGAKKVANSDNQPILYLRSFYYENYDKEPEEKGFGVKRTRADKEYEDEVIGQALSGIGPVVAVGRPSDRLPVLGATRLYFTDDEWMANVEMLMTISQIVIIQPGYSDGTEWEMIATKRLLTPDKVIFSFLTWYHSSRASRQREYEIFAMQIKRIFGCELPPKLGRAYFLYFNQDWEPILCRLGGWRAFLYWFPLPTNLLYKLLTWEPPWTLFNPLGILLRKLPQPRAARRFYVAGVREALRPLLRSRNIQVPVWRTGIFLAVMAGILLTFGYRIFSILI